MENITIINNSTQERGRVVARMSASPNPGIPLDLAKGDQLIIGNFAKKSTLVYTGKSSGENLSFFIQETRFGLPALHYNCYLRKEDPSLPFSGRNFLVSESDEGRILLQQER